jgi:hypothetical protein
MSFLPLVADVVQIVHDYRDKFVLRKHVTHGQKLKARWVLIRGYWSIGSAVLAQLPVSLIRLVVTLWKAAS